jgi:hypothetical protein
VPTVASFDNPNRVGRSECDVEGTVSVVALPATKPGYNRSNAERRLFEEMSGRRRRNGVIKHHKSGFFPHVGVAEVHP